MDIYAPPAPAQEHTAHQYWGSPGSCKWGARAAQELVGCAPCASVVPARQSGWQLRQQTCR